MLNAIHVAKQTKKEILVPKIEAKESEKVVLVLNPTTERVVSAPHPQAKGPESNVLLLKHTPLTQGTILKKM